MGLAVDQARVERCLDAVFDAALVPDLWSQALAQLADLFGAGFADLCSWTPDRSRVVGLVHGLDAEDYNDQMLGVWFNRNVWAERSPVRVAGEVISTRQMMAREDLRRSAMYQEYLHGRDLHEGLRLSLWVDEHSLSDISLLRPWSRGAFGPAEVALGHVLVPQLQRAAGLARRLSRTRFQSELGARDDPGSPVAVVTFDRHGRVLFINAAAEAVVRQEHGLRLAGQTLSAMTQDGTERLAAAVARAIGRLGVVRTGSTLRLPRDREGTTAVTVLVQPLSRQNRWPDPSHAAAVALFRDPDRRSLGIPDLKRMFGLTTAEAEVALDLLDGLTVQQSAAGAGRSRNTVRAHLARILEKTDTTRQVDLVRLLTECDRLGPTAKPFF